jgi:zinc protease
MKTTTTMKKIVIFATILFAFNFSTNAQTQHPSTSLGTSSVQTRQSQTPTPIDPAWRIGTLDNGMKYYIRHNATPANRASFWIAHDIGSLHEEHNQNGLAHFIEHMAFQGTKYFPGSSKVEYLHSLGLANGANINASVNVVLTQFMLTDIPMNVRETIVDTILLMLYGWAGNILFDEELLEVERGVIREEWRTRNSAQGRNRHELNRVFYPGTRWATRTTIGDTSVINNFTRDELLEFYHDWYRPNLQAIVIVGDINVDEMEQKIIRQFSSLKNPENPREKIAFTVPDNFEPMVYVYRDPELTQNSAIMAIKFPEKFDKKNNNTEENVRYSLMTDYITTMLNNRLADVARQPNAKFTAAGSQIGSFAGDRDAFFISVNTKNNELLEGFEEGLTFVEQARRFGFTATELERAKLAMLRRAESGFAERNSRRHSDYNRLAYAHFQNNASLMSEEQWLEMVKKFNPTIYLDELNQLFRSIITIGPNTIVFASGPDKSDVTLPTREQLTTVMYGVERKQLQPHVDVDTDKPLIAKLPKAGKVTKTAENTELGTTEWTLNNGMKVVLKQTPFKQDEITFVGQSFGGTSLLSDADWTATRNIGAMIGASGVGEFDRTILNRMLTGKRVSVSPSISAFTQSIEGSCSPRDLETALQLVHLYFTTPRFEQSEFDLVVNRSRNTIRNQALDPNTALRDTLNNLLTNFSFRSQPLTEQGLESLQLPKIRDVYKQRFANPGAFTFVFVGNINPETAKPLIEKYLGSLSGNKKENFRDLEKGPVRGKVTNHFYRPLASGKASMHVIYTGDLELTQENAMLLNYLARVLRLRYTEEIREKRGGTYGVQVRQTFNRIPQQRYNLTIAFDTDPELMEELVAVVYEELFKIANNGVLTTDFSNTQTNMKNQFEQNQKENSYWSGVLNNVYFNGVNNHTYWQQNFDKIDAKAIQDFAKLILEQQNRIEVVMLPE